MLDDAFLWEADLRGATLIDTRFRSASLYKTNLAGMDLRRAMLGGAWLADANLSNADLSGVDLTLANLSGANLKGARLEGVIWSKTVCRDGSISDEHGGSCVGHLGL